MSKDLILQPIRGRKPVLSWEDITELMIDASYQRSMDNPISRRIVKEIACNWDWGLCNVLLVADREGEGLFVVDGQHRLEAARLRGDVPHLPCVTFRPADLKAEADLFVKLNTVRKTASPVDRFFARCLAEDPEALEIQRIVQQAGLKVGKSEFALKPKEVACISVLTRLLRQYGFKILAAALFNLAETYRDEPLRGAKELLPGLCLLLLGNSDGAIAPEELPAVLKTRTQTSWIAAAKTAQHNDPLEQWPDEILRDLIAEAYRRHASRRHKTVKTTRTDKHETKANEEALGQV